MTFGTWQEHNTRYIISYRAIAGESSGLDGSHFSKWPTESIDFNIPACCPLGMIEFLVSKHGCSGPRNGKEVVTTTYLHEMCKKDAHGGTHL